MSRGQRGGRERGPEPGTEKADVMRLRAGKTAPQEPPSSQSPTFCMIPTPPLQGVSWAPASKLSTSQAPGPRDPSGNQGRLDQPPTQNLYDLPWLLGRTSLTLHLCPHSQLLSTAPLYLEFQRTHLARESYQNTDPASPALGRGHEHLHFQKGPGAASAAGPRTTRGPGSSRALTHPPPPSGRPP